MLEQERVATKARAKNQAPNVCLNGIPREIAGKKTARGTNTCLKACIIVDLHYTLNYPDCSQQMKSAAYSRLKNGTSFGGATNSRNSRATA